MALRVRDLLDYPGLRLIAHTAEDRLDAPIRWVATSEYLDPTPFLEGGELLLTTGMLLPSDAAATQAYADRLARAGVVALGLGVGLVHDEMPSHLVDAAAAAGLLLLEVPRGTPFIAISKATSDLIAKEQYAETVRIAHTQRDLVRAAARDGPAGVVRATARIAGGWALLLDRHLIVQHAHPPRAKGRAAGLRDELARLQSGGPAASSLVERDETISINTLAGLGRAQAFVVVGIPRRPDSADRALLNMSTSILSVALATSAASPLKADEQRSAAALFQLVRSLGTVDENLLADLGGPVFRHPEIRAIAVTGTRRHLDALCITIKDRLLDDCVVARVERRVTAILPGTLAHAAAEQVDSFDSLRAGLSGPVPPSALATALEAAEQSCARAVSLGVPVVMPAEGVDDVLAIADPNEAAAFAERLLGPIAEYQERTGNDLLTSLEVWLRHHARYGPAAAELGLHRHTLADRVRRAEGLIGHSLDDVDTRMNLWFALRTRQRTP